MASNFYDENLPDYSDLENATLTRPGFTINVVENDGGIGIFMGPVDDYEADTFHRAFLSVTQAQKLSSALEEAIARAQSKKRS